MPSDRTAASTWATPLRLRQPVRFNVEGSESDRKTALLSVGALGSGKTTLAQSSRTRPSSRGSGDRLRPEGRPPPPPARGGRAPRRVHPVATRSELTRHARSVAGRAEHLRQDADCLLPARPFAGARGSFLGDRCRSRRRSSDARSESRPASKSSKRSGGDETDTQVAKALEVYARSGLTQLGFADPAVKLPDVGPGRSPTCRSATFPAPSRDAAPSIPKLERVGEQIVRLIAMFAMHLMCASASA